MININIFLWFCAFAFSPAIGQNIQNIFVNSSSENNGNGTEISPFENLALAMESFKNQNSSVFYVVVLMSEQSDSLILYPNFLNYDILLKSFEYLFHF